MASASSAPPKAPTDDSPKCRRCEGALDTTGQPSWCRGCRAKYQREYKELQKEMTESRGYAAGISAMRAHLAEHFERLGSGSFSGYEAAHLIRQAKGPVSS